MDEVRRGELMELLHRGHRRQEVEGMSKFMGQAEKRKLVHRLKEHKLKIAAERDALRDTLSEFEEIIDSCDRAEEGLDTAIDALSELL